MAPTTEKMLWSDRKRILGMPITFTKYSLSEDRLFVSTGFLNLRYEEILLYRVRDISLARSFGQRIFGVGTITVSSSDKSKPVLNIINVKDASWVKELIHEQVEEMKVRRRVRFGEFMGASGDSDEDLDDDMDVDV